MSKHWKPGRQTIELIAEPRPSRIRRDPARLDKAPEVKPVAPELEIWGGIAGITLFAVLIVAAIVGIAMATTFRDDPAADVRAAQFGQCYNAEGANCVADGDTIYVGGAKVEIAGMDAPEIQGASCDRERSRGIDAAVRLAALLNSGPVTVGTAFRGPDGRSVSNVLVNGSDVAARMIDQSLAREPGNSTNWC